jgi:CTP:molybdopterin cytidylyltransferase MocA
MAASAPIDPQRISCIVLAAGGSRRLGFPKQLLRRRARPLLAHALGAARGALPHSSLIVVLGAQAQRLRLVVRRAAPKALVVYNARWAGGLASSLNAGLRAVPPRTAAILVTLVDQPNVDRAALQRLLTAWRRRPGGAAAALYAGHAGVPAVLPRRYWRAIRELRGDAGARALLRSAGVTTVRMPEAELDIDTPADAATLGGYSVLVAQLTQPVAPLA